MLVRNQRLWTIELHLIMKKSTQTPTVPLPRLLLPDFQRLLPRKKRETMTEEVGGGAHSVRAVKTRQRATPFGWHCRYLSPDALLVATFCIFSPPVQRQMTASEWCSPSGVPSDHHHQRLSMLPHLGLAPPPPAGSHSHGLLPSPAYAHLQRSSYQHTGSLISPCYDVSGQLYPSSMAYASSASSTTSSGGGGTALPSPDTFYNYPGTHQMWPISENFLKSEIEEKPFAEMSSLSAGGPMKNSPRRRKNEKNSSTSPESEGEMRRRNRRYKTPSPQILRARRQMANARERRRMNNLNVAYDSLREVLPDFDNGRRLSKMETLQMAQTYIQCLGNVLRN